MLLNAFVAAYVNSVLRQNRDFIGDRGWIHIGNRVIDRFENEGLFERDRKLVRPVFTYHDYYPRKIWLPADFRKALDIYEYDDENTHYGFVYEGGELRLTEDYEDCALIDTTARNVKGTPTTTAVAIDPYGSDDDTYQWYGVWFQLVRWDATAQAYPNQITPADTSLVYLSLDIDDKLYLRSALDTAPTVGDYVYLFESFLMLQYQATYAALTAANSEIPVPNAFETALASGMIAYAAPSMSKQRRQAEKDFEDDISNLGKSVFTPSPEEGRAKPRPYPDFSSEERAGFEFVGD